MLSSIRYSHFFKFHGGAYNNGVIFSMRPDGSDYQVLHWFDCSSGYWVDGRLLLAGDTLYGLVSHGGDTGNGVIFAFEPTVVIDGCDTEVSDIILPTGRSLSEEIATCAASAGTHGEFVSCVSHLTNDLEKDGRITNKEKGKIQSCVAPADLP